MIPRVLGFDPRLQFLHEDDLLRVLRHAVDQRIPGTFNVAGDGILMLSQAIRRLNSPTVSMPRFAVGRLGAALRQARVADFSPEQLGFLTYGRGVDTTRMRRARLRAALLHRRGLRRLRVALGARAGWKGAGRACGSGRRPARTPSIIPIGHQRPPGRGTGRERPSSAARSLAPAAKKPAAKVRPGRRREEACPEVGRP